MESFKIVAFTKSGFLDILGYLLVWNLDRKEETMPSKDELDVLIDLSTDIGAIGEALRRRNFTNAAELAQRAKIRCDDAGQKGMSSKLLRLKHYAERNATSECFSLLDEMSADVNRVCDGKSGSL